MTRDEALEKAIESLRAVRLGTGYSPETTDAGAHLAYAWLAVHDRLPALGADRSEPVTGMCDHDLVALSTGAAWVHPADMGRCDAPPQMSHG